MNGRSSPKLPTPRAGSVATPEVDYIFAYLNRKEPPKILEERRAARKARWAETQRLYPSVDSIEDRLALMIRAGLGK